MLLKYLLTILNICGLFCLSATHTVANTTSTVKGKTSTVVVNSAGKVVLPKNFTEANKLVEVNDDGKVVSPNNFTEANKLVTSEVVCLRIDMLDMNSKVESNGQSIFTDAELKILDKTGKLLYFATTLYGDIEEYHGSDGTHDENCKIYYYVSGKHYNKASGGCSNPKQKYTLTKDPDTGEGSSIGSTETNGKIIAIEFYPDLPSKLPSSGETLIRDIVLNPNNTIIVSRKGDGVIERDVDGNRIWRPVTIQYYTIPLSTTDE